MKTEQLSKEEQLVGIFLQAKIVSNVSLKGAHELIPEAFKLAKAVLAVSKEKK